LTVDTNTLHVDSTNNRVGVGTISPENPIEIETTNKLGGTFTGTTDGEGLRVTQTNYTSGNYISLVEAPFDDSQTAANVRIGAMFDGGGSHLAFGTSNSYGSGITNTAMFIDQVGNVGVGTTSPVGHGGFSSGRVVEVKNSENANTAADNSTISITSSNRHAGLSLESGANRNGYIQFGDPDDDDVGGITYVHTNNDMLFKTAATERLRILGGGGLTFNGDTATANALDDYEEGTFSPTLGASSSNPTIAYSQRQGRYVKVGNIVHFAVHILCGSFSGGSGPLQIQNLPFTMENVSNMFYAVTVGLSNNFTTTAPQGGLVLPNTTTMNLYHNEGTNSYSDLRVQTDVLAGTATSQIICSGSYRTT
jgi:hypothetical protein